MKKCIIEGCNETKIFTHGHCYKHKYLYYNSKPKKENKPKPQFISDEFTLAKIKKEKSQHIGNRCQFTGKYGGLVQLVHIIRRSDNQGYKCDERNLILGNQEFHTMFDDGKGWYLLQYFPWRMKAILRRMKDLDEFYFNRYCGKNGIDTNEI
jgi:hypothetical protein